MINENLLKSEMAKNGMTQEKLADRIGMNPTTLSRKIKGENGDFYLGEMCDICRVLKISNPLPIFFADILTETQES